MAKVYLNDRAAFERTARHWAQAYAQAPAGKGVPKSAQPGRMPTDADFAGLAEENVKQFEDMGFDRPKVVSLRLILAAARKGKKATRPSRG